MDLVFDPAWYLPVGLLVVGVTVFWTANRRLDKTLKNVGGVIVLAAVVGGGAGYVVRTPKEKALAHTRALLEAYEQRDWGKLEGLLDPATTLAQYGNREAIMRGARASVDDPGVKELYVMSAEATQIQTHIEVTTTVVTTVERAMGRPVRSTWQFEFVNMGGAWTLTTITPLALEGQSAEGMLRQLPR
jgi:hypothetical protein